MLVVAATTAAELSCLFIASVGRRSLHAILCGEAFEVTALVQLAHDRIVNQLFEPDLADFRILRLQESLDIAQCLNRPESVFCRAA